MKKEYKNKLEIDYENKYKGISIELGRNKEIKDGTGKKSIIQNINVLYNGTPIINQDYKMKNMVVQIFPDINEAIVGNIFLSEEFRGKGLAKDIYQAVANKLNIKIVNSLSRRDRLGDEYNQSESGSRVWKSRESFTPNKSGYNEKNKNSLEGKAISGLFILSFLAGIFLITFSLTGNIVGTSGTAHKLIGIIIFLFGISGFLIHRKLRG